MPNGPPQPPTVGELAMQFPQPPRSLPLMGASLQAAASYPAHGGKGPSAQGAGLTAVKFFASMKSRKHRMSFCLSGTGDMYHATNAAMIDWHLCCVGPNFAGSVDFLPPRRAPSGLRESASAARRVRLARAAVSSGSEL